MFFFYVKRIEGLLVPLSYTAILTQQRKLLSSRPVALLLAATGPRHGLL